MNGAVERANGTWRYEFYACYDLPYELPALNQAIDSVAHLYNHHRPHRALNGAMSLSLLKFVGQASLVDDAMLPS